MKKHFLFILCFCIGGLCFAEPLRICSFNVLWVGNSKKRDNAALAEMLKDFDIVFIEVVAPPFQGKFPNGESFKLDPESAAFFRAVQAKGFTFWLSEEDTGPGKKIHSNGAAT